MSSYQHELLNLTNELQMLRKEISDLKIQVVGDVKDLKKDTTVMVEHVDFLHRVYNCARLPINNFLVAVQSVSEWILTYEHRDLIKS
jgi:hypothetical protein